MFYVVLIVIICRHREYNTSTLVGDDYIVHAMSTELYRKGLRSYNPAP